VRANVHRLSGGYRCLSCNFDFGSLATDEAALERWMDANLRDGSIEMTITLHHLITDLPEPTSRARVMSHLQKHGIALPKSGMTSTLAIIIAVVVGVLALAIWFVATAR
jgi:hypothetical protein